MQAKAKFQHGLMGEAGLQAEMTSLERRETLSLSTQQPNGSAHLHSPREGGPGKASKPLSLLQRKRSDPKKVVQLNEITASLHLPPLLPHFLKLSPFLPSPLKNMGQFL